MTDAMFSHLDGEQIALVKSATALRPEDAERGAALELLARHQEWCRANGLSSVGLTSFAQRQDRRRAFTDHPDKLTRSGLRRRHDLTGVAISQHVEINHLKTGNEVEPDGKFIVGGLDGVFILARKLPHDPDEKLRQDHRHGPLGRKLGTVIHRLVSLIGRGIKAAFGRRVD